ncbi:MAG: hypothetical protein ACRBDI_03525 [Alphaproteobacteria bacterium]
MRISQEDLNLMIMQVDPEGLIAHGAPSDEYTMESRVFVKALSALSEGEITKENILLLLSEIWKESFRLDDDALQMRLPSLLTIVDSIMNRHSIS